MTRKKKCGPPTTMTPHWAIGHLRGNPMARWARGSACGGRVPLLGRRTHPHPTGWKELLQVQVQGISVPSRAQELESFKFHRLLGGEVPTAGPRHTRVYTLPRLSRRDSQQPGSRPLGSTSHEPCSVWGAGDSACPKRWIPRWRGPPRASTKQQLSARAS